MITKFISLVLLFKTQAPESLQALAPEKWFIQRAYLNIVPIKIIEFVSPFRQSVVYLDLKEEMAKTLPKRKILSENFCLGGQNFFLRSQCSDSSGRYFGLFLILYGDTTADFTFDIEFSVRAGPLGVLESKHKDCYSLHDNEEWGCTNLLPGMSWASLMAGKSRYFIDEVLHLRAEVTIMP